MQVKAVIFDLFNTLLLVEPDDVFYKPSLKKLHEFLVKNGVSVSFEEFERVYFEVRDRLYAETAKSLEEPHFNVRVSQTLQRLGYDFDVSDPVVVGATEAFADEFMRYVYLYEDTVDVLQKLYGKYKLGVVSNLSIPEIVWKLLEKFDLKRFFDVVLVSGAVNRRKPNPEIFEMALTALGVEASEAVFVGDTPSMDIRGAKNVGIKAILIERKTSATDIPQSFVWKPLEEDASIQPNRVTRSLRELLALLKDC